MRRLGVLSLLGLLGAAPVAAGCDEAAGNLLGGSNCGFAKDLAGWTAAPGASLTRDAADGGVLRCEADDGGSLTVFGPCVAVEAKTAYRVGARLRSAAGTAFFCSVNVFQYTDDRCSEGEDPLGSAAGPPRAAWAPLDGTATTSDAAKSVQVRPVCSGEPGFVVEFDDFVFGKS